MKKDCNFVVEDFCDGFGVMYEVVGMCMINLFM